MSGLKPYLRNWKFANWLALFARAVGAIVAICLLVYGLSNAFVSVKLFYKGKKANGKIYGIDVNCVAGRRSSTTYFYPIVAFNEPSGKEFRFTSSTPSLTMGFKKGDSVEVLFTHDNPAEAKINTFYYLWFFPMGYSLIGLGVLFALFLEFFKLKTKFNSEVIKQDNLE